jgi:hypothetical protein
MIRPRNELAMWTVYDHPLDFPNAVVARKFVVGPGGEQATNIVLRFMSINHARRYFSFHGLSCITRSPGDSPSIVETWL